MDKIKYQINFIATFDKFEDIERLQKLIELSFQMNIECSEIQKSEINMFVS